MMTSQTAKAIFDRAAIMRAAWYRAHYRRNADARYGEVLGVRSYLGAALEAEWYNARLAAKRAGLIQPPTLTPIQQAELNLACAEAIESYRVAQPLIAAARLRLDAARRVA